MIPMTKTLKIYALLACLLAAFVGGLGLAVYKRNSATWEKSSPAAAGGKVLGDFALNDVARVTIKNGGSSVTVAKKNDTWTVQDRGDYPADFALVDLDARITVDRAFVQSKSFNTPFKGWSLPGKILGTWVAGRQVWG